MWAKLDYRKKRFVLIGAMILTLYIAYVFSFKNTISAIKLNRTLSAEQNAGNVFDSSLAQISKEDKFYATIVKNHHIAKDDYENRLWQAVSGMASAHSVQITFNPTPTTTDTLALQKGLVSQQFNFKGNYFNLVRLLDTLGKSRGIGKISTMKIMVQRDNGGKLGANELVMQIGLSGLKK